MKLGAYTACLHDRPLDAALDLLAELGLTGAEVNTGGFLPSPHIPIADILSSGDAAQEYLDRFARRGIELTGLNCNGNPQHPDPAIGAAQLADLHRSIDLAAALGVKRIVCMSGLPAGEPGGTRPSWVVYPWNSVWLEQLEYQWERTYAVWRELDARARDADVRLCIEMHPHNTVFNPATLERLVTELGATHVGAELDPSHLFWQGMDPVAVVEHLGELVFHAAAKDVLVHEDNRRINGVLDERFGRIPAAEDPLPVGGGHTVSRWPADPAWEFVAVGRGHDEAYWARFLAALAEVDADMAVNIEHEDLSYDRVEGLRLAAENLRAAHDRAGL